LRFTELDVKKKNLFTDHDAFVEKFETKKTTDDCYTPTAVFDIVMTYVNEKCGLSGKKIIRPFYPGGDYESIEYPADCVVVDNPPFSIISKICRFYIERNVPFFLFAPHLTLFTSDIDCTHIVVGGNIVYENGAIVKTSFLSNMFGDAKIIGDAELYEKFRILEAASKVNLPKYTYPVNVITVSGIQWMVEKGVSIQINKNDAKHCRGLDSQKMHKKGLFGSGFLVSEKAAADRAAADRAAADRATADRAAADRAAADRAAADRDNHIEWELSEREWKIIRALG